MPPAKKKPARKIKKKPPVLAIDYGHVSAKCLLLKDSKAVPSFYEIPLGFSTTHPRLTVFENFLQVVKKVEELSGVSIVGKDFKKDRPRSPGDGPSIPSIQLPIIVSGELASLQFKNILAHPPIDPIDALKKLDLTPVVAGADPGSQSVSHSRNGTTRLSLPPLIDVRDSYTFVCGFTHREKAAAKDVSKWLPFEADLSEIENYLENKVLYNQLVPVTLRDLHIEQALAREKISQASDLRKRVFARELEVSEIVLTGAVFAKAPRFEQAMAIILDSLEPQGPLKIILDENQWLPAIGTLAFYSSDLAKKVLNQFSMKNLGMALPVSSSAKITIDAGLGEAQEVLVEEEGLVLFPFGGGSEAQVVVEQRSGKQSLTVSGGEVGLVIDSRARPLDLPKANAERRRMLKEWHRAINAFGETKEL